MSTLSVIIGFNLIAIMIGKRTKRFSLTTYSAMILIAFIDVALVLYIIYTMPRPAI